MMAERPSSAGKGLDVRLVTDEPDLVMAHLKARHASEEQMSSVDDVGCKTMPIVLSDLSCVCGIRLSLTLGSFVSNLPSPTALNRRRKELVKEQQGALAQRKMLSAEIGKLMKEKKNEEATKLKSQVEYASSVAATAEEQLLDLEQEMELLMYQIPNLLDDRVPEGKDEEANVVVTEWGTDKRKIGEGFLWHDDIASKVGGYDPSAAAKLSGARFSVLSGPVARLERAIIQFFLDRHTDRNGYREVSVPYIVSRSTLTGTGQLPKFENDLFAVNHQVNGEDAFLIPTAEVPITNLHRDEILDASQLPLSYVGLTPCFRAEAGSYGRDTKGLLRQHQFHKVELVKITTPEQSSAEHEALTQHAEECLKLLGLPYRKVRLCSGDIGFAATHCYDLEVWLPAQQTYREIASCSNCGDFQARRMGLRFRPAPMASATEEGKKGKKSTVLCHTINGSGLAVGRTLVAILENYQHEDGSVSIPEVLVPYMGGMARLEPVVKKKTAYK